METIIRNALAAVAVAMLLAVPAPRTSAAVAPCDSQFTMLCQGLTDYWAFEEATNYVRFGSYNNTPLFETGGKDVANSATHAPNQGSHSAYFNGNGPLVGPRHGQLPAYSTLAFWYYPVSQTANQAIFSTQSCSSTVGTTTKYIHMKTPTSGFGTSPQWYGVGTSNPSDAVLTSGSMSARAVNSGVYGFPWGTPEYDDGGAGRDDLKDIPVNAQITNVTVRFFGGKVSGGSIGGKFGVVLGSSTTWSDVFAPGTDATWHTPYASYNRPGGGSWTYGDLSGIGINVEIENGDGTGLWTIDELQLAVTHANCQGWDTGITVYQDYNNQHIKVSGAIQETDAVWIVDGPAVTNNAWNYVVVTFSPFGDYGKNQVCVQVGNTSGTLGTPTCQATGYWLRGNAQADWLVGGLANGVSPNYGYIDGLLIAGRVWSQTDVKEFYNNGAGHVVPFY